MVFVRLLEPDIDGRGVFVTESRVDEELSPALPPAAASEVEVVGVVVADEGLPSNEGDGADAVSDVTGGTHTDVVTVVGWSLSVQVAVVSVWIHPAGAVKSDALGAFPACHDSGS